MVLAAVFVLVKANRNRRALLILIPLLILSLLWIGFKKVMSFPTSSEMIFDQIVYSLIVGIAVVFLLGHKLGGRNRFVTFLLASGVMAGVLAVCAISNFGIEFSREMLGAVIYFISLALPMLLSVVLAGWRCRKRYSSLHFMLWLAVCIWVVSVTFVLAYFVIFMVIMSDIGLSVSKLTIIILMSSLVISVFSYVILLPYMILAFRSSFFRERFFACMGLHSMAATAEPGADGLSEQSTTPEMPESGDLG